MDAIRRYAVSGLGIIALVIGACTTTPEQSQVATSAVEEEAPQPAAQDSRRDDREVDAGLGHASPPGGDPEPGPPRLLPDPRMTHLEPERPLAVLVESTAEAALVEAPLALPQAAIPEVSLPTPRSDGAAVTGAGYSDGRFSVASLPEPKMPSGREPAITGDSSSGEVAGAESSDGPGTAPPADAADDAASAAVSENGRQAESVPPDERPEGPTAVQPRDRAEALVERPRPERDTEQEREETGGRQFDLNRTVAAREGAVFTVVLPRIGWIFLGSRPPGAVEYVKREYDTDRVRFFFRALTRGEFDLEFDGQDLASGRRERRLIGVEAQPGAQDVASMPDASGRVPAAQGGDDTEIGAAQDEPDPGARSADTPRPGAGDARLAADTPRPAGDTTRPASDDGNGGASQGIGQEPVPGVAEPAADDQEVPSSRPSALPEDAEQGLSLRDGERSPVRPPRLAPEPANRRERIEMARAALTDGNHSRVIELLSPTVAEEETPGDEVLFYLASAYERSGRGNNIARARDLFERLVAEYPFSRFWTQAKQRLEHIERHFFDIR